MSFAFSATQKEETKKTLQPLQSNTAEEKLNSLPLFTAPPTYFDSLDFIGKMIERQDYTLAASLLDEILRKNTLPPDEKSMALLMRASVSLMMKEKSQAIFWLTVWLEHFPGRPEAAKVSFQLAKVYQELKSYDRAREALYSTLSFAITQSSLESNFEVLHPLTKAASWELAETEYHEDNWGRAAELFQRFRQHFPEQIDLVHTALFREADCTYQQRDIPRTISKYEKALSIAPFHPFSPEARLRLMELYGYSNNKKRFEEEQSAFIWTVETLQPELSEYWQKRASTVLMNLFRKEPFLQKKIISKMDFSNKVEDKAWQETFSFYIHQFTRSNEISELFDIEKAAQDPDGWMQWNHKMQQKNAELRQKKETLLQQKKK